jgi:hypothetical protein
MEPELASSAATLIHSALRTCAGGSSNAETTKQAQAAREEAAAKKRKTAQAEAMRLAGAAASAKAALTKQQPTQEAATDAKTGVSTGWSEWPGPSTDADWTSQWQSAEGHNTPPAVEQEEENPKAAAKAEAEKGKNTFQRWQQQTQGDPHAKWHVDDE